MSQSSDVASNITWHTHSINKADRQKLNQHKSCVLWFTGLSGSGKSTLATLHQQGIHCYVLDGDNVRHGLNKDLGFSDEDRQENIRRIAEVAKLFVDAGVIVLSAFISPFKADREIARQLVEKNEFIEIFVDCPLEVCEERDTKGLYAKARKGEIKQFTGIDSPYEAPDAAELAIKTGTHDLEACVRQITDYLKAQGILQ